MLDAAEGPDWKELHCIYSGCPSYARWKASDMSRTDG